MEPPETVEPPPSVFHAPVRLEDNNTPGLLGSVFQSIASTPGGVLFSVTNYEGGVEYWRSDGTQGGTFSLGMSLLPGVDADTYAAGLVAGVDDYLRGARLWRMRDDGQILSPVMAAAPVEVRKLGGRYLVLTQSALVSMSEDATQEVLAELVSGAAPRFVALVAGRHFFLDGAKRLWVTDGTRAGTRLVYTFAPGTEIFQGAAAGSRLVLLVGFSSPSEGGPQPWASDGTPEGTFQIEQLEKYALSTSGTKLLSIGSSVVFLASDFTTGFELRATDGTPGSLRTLTELCEPPGCSANIQLLAQAGAFAFFSARDAAGPWLWRTDGTPEGTLRLTQGSASKAVTVGGVAYVGGEKLWRTDGSVEGTVVLEPGSVVLGEPVDGVVPYLRASTLRIATGTTTRILTGSLPQTQILGRTPSHAWVLSLPSSSLLSVDEDTGAQTVIPALPPVAGSYPRRLMPAQDSLFYLAFNGQGLLDLRSSEGSAESTRTVSLGLRVPCGPECAFSRSDPVPMTVAGETFFFRTASGVLTAVTAGGAQTEVRPPSSPSRAAVPFHGRMLFSASSSSGGGRSLWTAEADGSRATEVFTFPPAPPVPGKFVYRYPTWFVVSGDTVFIWVSMDGPAEELWAYDEAGGGRLLGTYSSTLGGLGHALSPRGLVFACPSADLGQELCASDGTPEGTRLLADLRPGAEGSEPRDLVRFRDHVYFTADDGVHGRELWVSDGTPEGTRLAFDVLPGAESSEPGYLAAGKTQLYFRARTPELGAELWSLGLEGPPVPLTDMMPGERNGLPPRPLAVRDGGNWLVFAARTPENGEELWLSDGTREGTRLVADVLPGPQSSAPFELQLSTSHIYFGARDATHGKVPWAIGFEKAPEGEAP